MKTQLVLPAALGAALLVASCGGGGGGGSDGGAAAPPATVQKSDVPVTVVDGAIKDAKVCLDKNRNNACDPDEPSATTDAAGKATLKVDPDDVGKYPVVAEVGADAVDAVSGRVGTAYVMKAPADRTAVVSPLTTLVQNTVANTGVTSTAAEANLRAQIGVNVSLFTDFTASSGADANKMGTLARLVVATTQEQTKQLATAVGRPAIDGKSIELRDVQEVVQQKLLEALPDVVAKLGDARIAGADPASVSTTVMVAVAQEVTSSSIKLTTDTLTVLVAVTRGTDTTTDSKTAVTASGVMPALDYTDANNWFRRVISGSVAQNTPDSSGFIRFVDRRNRSVAGNLAVWSFGGDPSRQTDLHWNGSAWVGCTLNMENRSTPRDAQGRSEYDYCDGFEKGVTTRATIDVGGRAMNDVYQQIRNAGYENVSIANAATALGTTAFPTDAKLFFQLNTPVATAPSYVPTLGNDTRDTRADVASGDPTACNAITFSTPQQSYTTLTTTITGYVAARPGTPCKFGPGTVTISTPTGTATVSSGPRNEWWGQSTSSIGTVGNAPVGGTQTAYYTTNTLLRASFGANQTTKYYTCQQRSTDGSPRNCDLIGTGTYTIATLGDAKVLSFENEPAQFSSLRFRRIFVERGGKVHFGYVNRPIPKSEARLNLRALNALSTKLGMPTVDPEVPLALTAASYQGDWIVNDQLPLDLFSGTTLRFSASGGAPVCIDNDTNTVQTCTVTLTGTATGDFTYSAPDGTATGKLNFNTGTASGTFTPLPSGAPTAFTGMRR